MKTYKNIEILTYGTNLKMYSCTVNGKDFSSSSWSNLKKQINKNLKK